jgi:hypothetical protein
MNRALRMLFGSGYRMRSAKGKQVGHLMFSFLGHYAMCANITMGASKRSFAMTPQHHMIAHDAHDLLDQSAKFD